MSARAGAPAPAPALPERGAPDAGTLACLAALAYVDARRWARRLRALARQPWPLLGLVVSVAIVAGLQVYALGRVTAEGAPDPEFLDLLLRFAPLLLPAVLLTSTFSTPVRLQVAEVSWVLTAPGGARALIVRALVLQPLAYAAIGYLGALLARAWLGQPLSDAWKIALVGALLGLVVRLLSFGGHILVVRARAAIVLRVLAVAWGIGLLVAAFVDVPGGGWLGLRPVLEPLLAGVLVPAQLSPLRPLVVLAALLPATVALVVAAKGYEERAHTAARAMAEAQEMMRRSRDGQTFVATRFRTGLPSLPGWPRLTAERALCFRTLCQQRRILHPGVFAAAACAEFATPLVLLAVAPAYVWVPALLGVVGAMLGGASQGLAVECNHYHLRLAPLRPLPALLWLGAVPWAHRVVGIELAWLPVLAAPGVTVGAWVGGMLLIACIVAFGDAGGSLAVASTKSLFARIALKVAIVTLGALPAGAALVAADTLGLPWLLTALAAAIALLAAGAACLLLAARQIWPRSRTHAAPIASWAG